MTTRTKCGEACYLNENVIRSRKSLMLLVKVASTLGLFLQFLRDNLAGRESGEKVVTYSNKLPFKKHQKLLF